MVKDPIHWDSEFLLLVTNAETPYAIRNKLRNLIIKFMIAVPLSFFISCVYSFTMLHLYFNASVSKLKYMTRHVVYEKISCGISNLFYLSPGENTRGLKMRKVEKILFFKTEISEWALWDSTITHQSSHKHWKLKIFCYHVASTLDIVCNQSSLKTP